MLPDNKRFFQAHLISLRKLIGGRYTPARLIAEVLGNWIRLATPDLSRRPTDTHSSSPEIIVKFASWLAESDILVGAFWLSTAYAELIEKERKKSAAMYFTPPYLSNRMLDNAGDSLYKGTIIDPACGGAAFLAAAAQRIAVRLEESGKSSEGIISYIEANLFGVDADPFLCTLAETFLRMVLARHVLNLEREPKFHIHCGDGLTAFETYAGTFRLVLSNPPYRKMCRDEVARYINTHSKVIEGQPNLYTLFIHRAAQLLKTGGHAVLLTPMSYLSGRSFSKLRTFVANSGHVRQLDLIHNKNGVFMGVEQDAVVTVWDNSRHFKDSTRVYSLAPAASSRLIGELHISKPNAPWPVPKCKEDVNLHALLSEIKANLRDYGYRAKIGAIVIHRDPRRRFSHAQDAQNSECVVPLVWSRDIGHDGKLNLRDATQCPERFIDIGSTDSSACVTRPAVALQRVTSTDQKRRLICAPIPEEIYVEYGGVSGENHVCFLESLSNKPAVSPVLLSKILRTDIMDRLFRCISGATNVSVYELNQIPLPDIDTVRVALKQGKSIETAVRIGFELDKLKLHSPEPLDYKKEQKKCYATRT